MYEAFDVFIEGDSDCKLLDCIKISEPPFLEVAVAVSIRIILHTKYNIPFARRMQYNNNYNISH